MKNNLIRANGLIVLLTFFSSPLRAIVPYLSFRSQGFNAARELVGWQTQINRYDWYNCYGSFSVTPEYEQSFKPCQINSFLFADAFLDNDCTGTCGLNCADYCCCNYTIAIEGTKVANRNPQALMAENFYLPADFKSRVSFKPMIKNFVVDVNLYLGLDKWCEGLYFRIHAPLVNTRWNLNICEEVLSTGTYPYDPGYFNNSTTPAGSQALIDRGVYGIARNKLLNCFEEYACLHGALANAGGITYYALNNARMALCGQHKTGIAEITAALGWNFVNCPDYTFGLNIRAAAPTGTRPEGVWLFEPIVGQGKHWELGAGFDTRIVCWQNCDETKDFTIYVDGNVTHLFKTEQRRTFDLCGKPLSRYMMAMKFTDAVSNLVAGDVPATGDEPKYQFDKIFTPLANITTLPVNVSAAVQGEVVIKLAYTHSNWQFDVGYDFWGRSCENISKNCSCGAFFAENTWALKGDAFVYGFTSIGSAIAAVGTPLSATEREATIFKGTNNFGQTTSVGSHTNLAWNENPGVDNAAPAWADKSDEAALFTHQMYTDDGTGAPLWNQVFTSNGPLLLQESDIDLKGAQAKSMSNKVFGHIGYVFNECCYAVPYLGFGGEIEFGMREDACNKQCKTSTLAELNTCTVSCSGSCGDNNACFKTISLSQWGVWVKGGVSFN